MRISGTVHVRALEQCRVYPWEALHSTQLWICKRWANFFKGPQSHHNCSAQLWKLKRSPREHVNEWVWLVPIKLYSQKQLMGYLWPMGQFTDPCSSPSWPCIYWLLLWRGNELSLPVESKATSLTTLGWCTVRKVGPRSPGTDVHQPSPWDVPSPADRENHRGAFSKENINPCHWLLSRRENSLTSTCVYTQNTAV